jgi:methylglutaconyl-CoA hydratase
VSTFETLLLDINDQGVARLTLNRPEARNAMSQELIRDLTEAARQLAADDQVRVVVLSGAGEIFCAGGDLKMMQRQVTGTRESRVGDARELAQLLSNLDRLPKPIVGRINGPAFGGGLGLISICDIAIGTTTSKFCLTEVKLGLIPATISPFVVARMGVTNARRVMLNAHEMDGTEAVSLGLLSAAVEPQHLDVAVEREVQLFLRCAPQAVAKAKQLIQFVSTHSAEENLLYTAERLADCWESPEIQEGIAAFLSKRKPAWHVGDGS